MTRQSWFRIQAADGATRIQIYDEIGAWGVTAQMFLAELDAIDGPVEVRLNSNGGDVFDAFAIYNALASRPDVTTMVDGVAASAASVIVMAGEARLMARTSQLMIHDGWAAVAGNADELEHMVGRLQAVSDQIADVYAMTAGGDAGAWREAMRAETWYTPAEALEAGLITGIVETSRETVPAAASVGDRAGIQARQASPSSVPGDQGSAAITPATTREERPMEPTAGAPLTIEARRSRNDYISNRLQEIAAAHPDSTLPGQVQAEWDQLLAERAENVRVITEVDSRNDQIAQILAGGGVRPTGYAADGGLQANGGSGTVYGPRPGAAPAVHIRPGAEIYDLAAIRSRASSFEELPGLYREAALRIIDEARFPVLDFARDKDGRKKYGDTSRERLQQNVRDLLDTIDEEDAPLARRIIATASPLYARAFFKACRMGGFVGLDSSEIKALTVGGTTSAGLAVPITLDPTVILTSDGVTNPLRAISRVERIVNKEWDGVTSAGVTVTRAAEAAEVGNNDPTMAQPKAAPQRVQGFIPFSIEADMDWSQLQAEMTRLLTDAKDVEEATAFLTGNGTPPNPQGILTGLTVSQQVIANTITAAALQQISGALGERWQSRAQIVAARNIHNAIHGLDTTSGTLYAPLTAGLQRALWGYPADVLSTMANTNPPALNDKWLLLGDFSQFIIVDRIGMNVELVPVLFGASQRPTGQRGIYAIWRNTSLVLVPGAFRYAQRTT